MTNKTSTVENNISSESDPYAHMDQNDIEQNFLMIGSAASLVLPQLVCFVYGGIMMLLMSGIWTIAGIMTGVTMYYRFPYKITSCISDKMEKPLGLTWLQKQPSY